MYEQEDDWRKKESLKWKSSYEEYDYGSVFYGLIRAIKPLLVVELGTKAGYSAFYIAKALKENGKGKIHCYDLWEKYQYNSTPIKEAEDNLKEFIKEGIITLNQRDVLGVDKDYESIDILHVDTGNHGGILNEIIPYWLPKVKSLIILEGGSEERDQVDWMKKYNKVPIRDWLYKNKNKFNYIVLKNFPSLTIIEPLK
jgi:hypothetical protein